MPHLLELGLERHDDAGDRVGVSGRRLELDHFHRGQLLARAVELATACVTQAPPDRVGRLEVDDEECSSKPGARASDLAGIVEDDGVPVEDELVLAADEIAERDVGARVSRARDEHVLALLGLADVEGRRGQVDDELGTGERRGRSQAVRAARRPRRS